MSWGAVWGALWGGGSSGGFVAFFVVGARASSSSSFQVTFSVPPLFGSPLVAGDASNLAYWTLTRTDTGTPVPLLAVRAVPGQPAVLEFVIAGRFNASALATYQMVGSSLLESSTGSPITTPMAASFFGMPVALPAAKATDLVDLRNPQASLDSYQGALSVSAGSDYRLEAGVPLLKKLIYRCITTVLDEFYHLAGHNYGAGVQDKNFYTATDVIGVQTNVTQQVQRQMPELTGVSCTATLSAGNVFTVVVSGTVKKTGQRISVTTPLPGNATAETS